MLEYKRYLIFGFILLVLTTMFIEPSYSLTVSDPQIRAASKAVISPMINWMTIFILIGFIIGGVLIFIGKLQRGLTFWVGTVFLLVARASAVKADTIAISDQILQAIN